MRAQLIFVLLLVGLASLLTLQCSDQGKPIQPSDNQPPTNRTVSELTQQEKDLVASVNTFGFKLFQRVDKSADKGKNVFISPLSVSYALGIAYNGANGQTQTEMASALEISGFSVDEANRAYQGLTSILTQADPAVKFTIANSFWSRVGKEIQPQFIKVCNDYFNATAEMIDFQAADAAGRINGWVSDNTGGKITKIVDPPIPDGTAAILLNALYLKANWTYPFDTALTHAGSFYLTGGGETTCDMMLKETEAEREGNPNYADRPLTVFNTDVCQGVNLPYGNEGFRMTVLLPVPSLTADSLISLLTPETWEAWRQTATASDITLLLPKFKFEFEVKLNDALKAMGMQAAFTGDADFSDLFVDGVGWIDEVRHKTFVQVDEKGTEAAAVTSVVFGDSIEGPLFVNRPFVFVIHEAVSGAVLFMGKIENPKWE